MGSYNTVEYRLIQQEDSDCEGDLTPLRTRRRTDKMNLSVHNRPLLLAAYLAVSLIGVTFVITTIVWAAVFKNGIKFSSTELGIDFNWHPILMTISLLFLYGNGALIYRVIPAKNDGHKLKLKIGHALTTLPGTRRTSRPPSPTCTHCIAGWGYWPPRCLDVSGCLASSPSCSPSSPETSGPCCFLSTSTLAPPSWSWLPQPPSWATSRNPSGPTRSTVNTTRRPSSST